jgi:predicted choloylglycine hydrolase
MTIEIIPSTFTIDLDLAPGDRWKHVVSARKSAVIHFSQNIKSIIKKELGSIIAWLHIPLLRPLCYLKCIPKTLSQEIYGIAQEMNDIISANKEFNLVNITYSDLVLFNVALDFLAKCTSIIASTRDGQIHARTLDWDIPLLKELTIVVQFKKAGEIIYQGVTFLGCVGLLTGMRNNGFSVSYNFRKTTINKFSLMHLLGAYISQTQISFLLRQVLDKCKNYNCAKHFLENIRTASSGYIIICGIQINEGIIIAKNANRAKNTYGNDYIICMNDKKYLIQTNHDYNFDYDSYDEIRTVDPKWAGDDIVLQSTIERKKTAESLLCNRNLSLYNVENVMCVTPIQNPTTVFTCIMTPSINRLNCYLDIWKG